MHFLFFFTPYPLSFILNLQSLASYFSYFWSLNALFAIRIICQVCVEGGGDGIIITNNHKKTSQSSWRLCSRTISVLISTGSASQREGRINNTQYKHWVDGRFKERRIKNSHTLVVVY